MGTDIGGWLEARGADGGWRAASPLGDWYGARDYDSFGCLFGVRNHAGFRPLAPARGLPDDASPPVRAAYAADDELYGATWVAWSQLRTVDWAEPAERPDARVHEYRVDTDGRETYVGKASWSRALGELTGQTLEDWTRDGEPAYAEGTQWRAGELLFRVERLVRADAVRGWEAVFAELERLAAAPSGGGDARLVVWFDR